MSALSAPPPGAAEEAAKGRRALELAKCVSPVAAGGIIAAGIGTVWWALALHVAPATQVGRFVAALGLATLLAEASNLGVGYVFIRFLPERNHESAGLVRTGLVLAATVSILLAAGVTLGTALPFARIPLPTSPSTFLALALAACATCMYTTTDNLLLATGQRRAILVRSASTSVLRLLGLGTLVASGHLEWYSLVAGYSLPQGLAAVAAASYLFRVRAIPRHGPWLLGFSTIRRYASYASQSYVGNIITAAVPNLLPVIVLSRVGAVESARFGACWMIASLVMLVPVAVSLTSFSAVARGEQQPDDIFVTGMLLMLVIQVPVIVMGVFVAPIGLRHLGGAYAQIHGEQMLPLLLGVACVGITSQIYSRARVTRSGLRIVIAGQGLQALVTLPSAYVLVGAGGAVGASLAWLAGALAALSLGWVVGRPYLERAARRGRLPAAAPERVAAAAAGTS